MSFLVYKSSAGSGKTFTLVKEYLKLALGSDDSWVFSKILAITFTNKAANEMTDRILETLIEISNDRVVTQSRTKDLHQMLANELDVTEEVIKERARKTLKKVLHNYRDFSVGTIDSFVHRIIRSFATEMGLNQQFDVELNTENVLRRAVDLMLEKVGVNKDLTFFIEQYVDTQFDKGRTWKIEDNLFDFSRGLLKTHDWFYIEKAKSVSLKTYIDVHKKWSVSVKKYHLEEVRIAQLVVDLGLDGLKKEDYAHGGQFIGFFQKIMAGDIGVPPGGNVIKLVNDPDKKWYSAKSAGSSLQLLIEDKKPKLLAYYALLMKFREEGLTQYQFDSLVLDNIYKVALLAEVDKEVQKIKEENDLVLISDFTDLVGQVTRNEPVPFIYEKLGERYAHFLFDEFQDTSLMQWHNMLPLVENSLSQMGTSLVVGDAKQSIYRWRGGVAEQFSQLPEVFNPYQDQFVAERAISVKVGFENRDPLNTNYRSNANIVKFNNQFFKAAANVFEDSVGAYYEDVEQKTRGESGKGFVSFQFFHDKTKDELREKVFAEIAHRIQDLIGEGYAYKDIAILTKKKADTPALVEKLTWDGIKVISSESLLVNNSTAVKLLVSVLQHLSNPSEAFYMSELLIRINDVSPKSDFHRIISTIRNLNFDQFQGILLGWGVSLERSEILSLPLYEMVSTVVEVFGLQELKDNRLAAWMGYVYNMSLKSGRGLFDLLDDWKGQQSVLSIKIPEDVDAVNVMTIHKAKGLDWPVVIVAEGNWPKVNKDHTIWVELPEGNPLPVANIPHTEKKLVGTVFENQYLLEKHHITLDHLNAMYVAFTRPVERLYVMSMKPKSDFFGGLYSILEDMEGSEDVTVSFTEDKKGKNVIEKFTFGKEEPKEPAEVLGDKAIKLIKIKNAKNSAYREKLKVKKNYLQWLNDAGEMDYGTLVHRAFSYIETIDDIDASIKKLMASGNIDKSESNELKKILHEVISNPQVQPFFKKGLTVKNEAEIITSNGELLRPDRVIIENDEATIIDFKTGMRKPAHDEQVLSYKSQLLKMGYKNVKSVLIYTHDIMVVEV